MLAVAVPAARATLFDVDGISVSVKADNAVQAKQKAIADAMTEALQRLMTRLTRAEDHDRLPKVDPASINDMLSAITVVEEQSSGTHYSATFKVKFEPEAIRVLLGHAGVGFVERRADPVLVVPIFRSDEDVTLWEDNPYLDAWQSLDTANALTPVKLPTADIRQQGVNPEAVLADDYDAMFALRYLYDTRFILISQCQAAPESGALSCSMRGETPAGQMDVTESISGSDDVAASAMLAAQTMLARLQDKWKSESLSGTPALSGEGEAQEQTVPVSVSFEGLREWQALRARLAAVPGVSEIEIASLNAKGADLNIRFLGSIDQFAQMVTTQNMELLSAGERWTLQAY